MCGIKIGKAISCQPKFLGTSFSPIFQPLQYFLSLEITKLGPATNFTSKITPGSSLTFLNTGLCGSPDKQGRHSRRRVPKLFNSLKYKETLILLKGYYSVMLDPSLKLIGLNTLYGDMINFYQLVETSFDPGKQMEWLQGELQDCRMNNKKAIILGHIPCVFNPRIPALSNQMCKIYVNISGLFSDVISAHIYGHTVNFLFCNNLLIFLNFVFSAFRPVFTSQTNLQFQREWSALLVSLSNDLQEHKPFLQNL